MKLTDQEKLILNHLADAWNEFVKLPNRSESDNDEFCRAIHAAQDKMSLRVARRVDVDFWRQPKT